MERLGGKHSPAPSRNSWLWDGKRARANSDTSCLSRAPGSEASSLETFPASSACCGELTFYFLSPACSRPGSSFCWHSSVCLPGRCTERPPLSLQAPCPTPPHRPPFTGDAGARPPPPQQSQLRTKASEDSWGWKCINKF